LIIDEAHQIPQSVLEEVRLLANFETAQQKLLQILLVGQPELDKKLDSVELRSLKQRIAVRCHLEPLRGEEIRRYIERRLELSGADPQAAAIFPAETARAIESYSSGIPRLINSICDQALTVACARQLRVVPVEIIDEVASRFRLAPTAASRQTEKLFSPVRRLETSAPDRSSESVPAPNVPAVRTPYLDAAIKHLSAASEKPETPSNAPEPSPQVEIRDAFPYQAPRPAQKAIDPDPIRVPLTDFGVQRLKEVAEAVCLQSDVPHVPAAKASLTAPGTVAPPESAWGRPRIAEPISLAPKPQLTTPPPAISQTVASAGPGVAFRSDHILRAARSFQLRRRRLTPALLMSLLIGTAAAAVVAVALPAAVFMARRQRPVTVTHQPSSIVQTSPAEQTAAPLPPASSPLPLDAGGVDSIVPQTVTRPHESAAAAEPEQLTLRRKVVVGTLSKPVFKSPRLSTASEPPPIVGAPAKELALGSGLLDISVPGPEPAEKMGGHLQPPKLVSSSPLVYPPLARTDRLQGLVVIDALVDATGKVTDMTVISGPSGLTGAAMDALRTWKYQPGQLNGQPIAMRTHVSINFNLR
jgi:TonB family protein